MMLMKQMLLNVKTPHQARQITHFLLGTIARAWSLPPTVLSCPSSSRQQLLPLFAESSPPVDWGMQDGPALYALDWSAPRDSSFERIISADRDVAAHDGSIFVCFGDLHGKRLKLVDKPLRKPDALVTEGCDGQPVMQSVKLSEANEDIFSADGDGGDPLSVFGGDPAKSWVK